MCEGYQARGPWLVSPTVHLRWGLFLNAGRLPPHPGRTHLRLGLFGVRPLQARFGDRSVGEEFIDVGLAPPDAVGGYADRPGELAALNQPVEVNAAEARLIGQIFV